MFDFVPDPERLSRIFATATAPTFFLGAVAAFAALMTSRMRDVLDIDPLTLQLAERWNRLAP